MLITKISHRRKGITAVYVSEREEPFLLDGTVVKENNITEKTEISDMQMIRLSRLSEMNSAKNRALRLIEFRAHSQRELENKLKKEYSSEATDYAVEKMLELGLINDREYALNKARYYTEIKRYAPSRVKRELKTRGVDSEHIEYALSQLDTDLLQQLERIIQKRFTPLPQDEKGKRRMINYLLRQGYSYYDISKVTKITE